VFEALEAELRKDRAKTNLLQISSLGLVEMTRKRTRENLGRTLSEPCPYCDGKGYLRSKPTVAYEVFRDLRRKRRFLSGDHVVVQAHPDVVRYLYEEERASLEDLERTLGRRLVLKAREDFHQEDFEVVG
jgi:ribonuclease G